MSPMIQLEPLRALVVDADAVFATRLASGLVEYGIDAVAMGSVKEAIAAIATRPPDVLILAPFLRDGSGLQAIEALRARGTSCAATIIALSRTDDGPPPLIAAKCDGFLAKPCSAEQVLDRIDQLLEPKTAFATPSVEQLAG